jgi:hypothetical protein
LWFSCSFLVPYCCCSFLNLVIHFLLFIPFTVYCCSYYCSYYCSISVAFPRG